MGLSVVGLILVTSAVSHLIEVAIAEKARLYAGAPAGLPLVQHALPSLFEQVHAGLCSVETVVEKTAHAPARLFDVTERGFIREGYWADLVLVHPSMGTPPTPIYSKCGWSPFANIALHAQVRMTWINGELRYQDGTFLPGANGRALEFNRP